MTWDQEQQQQELLQKIQEILQKKEELDLEVTDLQEKISQKKMITVQLDLQLHSLHLELQQQQPGNENHASLHAVQTHNGLKNYICVVSDSSDLWSESDF